MASVTGFETVLDSLSQLEDRIAKKKILVRAMRKAMLPLQEEIQRTAPDDQNTPDSRIRKYTRRAVLDQSSVGVLGKVGVSIQGYAGYFREFGTEFEAAVPFAEPAEQSTESEFMRILGEELWLGVLGAAGEEFDNG